MINNILKIVYLLVNLVICSILALDERNVRSKTSNVIPLSRNITNVVPVKVGGIITSSRSQSILVDKLRQEFPNCPMSCEESWIKDGWCDKECYSDDCGNDGGDCIGWCAPECRPSWQGDGQCDIDCFNSKCNWDNNDCFGNEFEERKRIVLMIEGKMNNTDNKEFEFDYSKCKCDKKLLGNNVCDIECNKIECNMDKGDCLHRCNSRCINTWLGDGQCDPSCDNEECFFDKGDCKSCSDNCRTWMIGNGICDTSCNNRDCSYDGGDCSNVCSVSKIDYNNQPLIYKFCLNSWVGDGYCDEDCNNKECNYDKGDCIPKNNSGMLDSSNFDKLNLNYFEENLKIENSDFNFTQKINQETLKSNLTLIARNNTFSSETVKKVPLSVNKTTTTTIIITTTTTKKTALEMNLTTRITPKAITTETTITTVNRSMSPKIFMNELMTTTTTIVTKTLEADKFLKKMTTNVTNHVDVNFNSSANTIKPIQYGMYSYESNNISYPTNSNRNIQFNQQYYYIQDPRENQNTYLNSINHSVYINEDNLQNNYYTRQYNQHNYNQNMYSSNQNMYSSNQNMYSSNQNMYSSNQNMYSSNQNLYSNNQNMYSNNQNTKRGNNGNPFRLFNRRIQ